jgi:hypothetical protein
MRHKHFPSSPDHRARLPGIERASLLFSTGDFPDDFRGVKVKHPYAVARRHISLVLIHPEETAAVDVSSVRVNVGQLVFNLH